MSVLAFPLPRIRACQRYPVAGLKQPLQAHCIGRGRPRTASPSGGFHLRFRPRGSSNVRASLFDSWPAAIRAFAAGGQGCSIEAAQEQKTAFQWAFFLLKRPLWFADAGLRLLWNVDRYHKAPKPLQVAYRNPKDAECPN